MCETSPGRSCPQSLVQRTLQSDCSHRKTRPFGIIESSCGRCGLVESPQPPERNTKHSLCDTLSSHYDPGSFQGHSVMTGRHKVVSTPMLSRIRSPCPWVEDFATAPGVLWTHANADASGARAATMRSAVDSGAEVCERDASLGAHSSTLDNVWHGYNGKVDAHGHGGS